MKNILNHNGIQTLLSNVDDGSNRIVINDVEIPSSSWVGTGNYTQTISGTTITIAKVADLDGNVMLQLVSANTYRLVKYVKAEYLTTTGDTKDNVTTFQSSDTTDALATAWTSVTKLDSGEKQSSIFAKMSQMFKNIRYLYKMLGTTDISQIGGGNVTGAISSLNTSLTNKQDKLTNPLVQADVVNNLTSTATNKPLSAYQGKVLNDRLTPIGGGYISNYTVLATSYTAGTKVKVASFTVSKAGLYIWSPRFRSTLSRDGYMSAVIGDNNTPQYSVGAYNTSVTQTGAGGGVVASMSGMAFYSLAANTTYYVWFESNVSGSGVNTFNWYSLVMIKPS